MRTQGDALLKDLTSMLTDIAAVLAGERTRPITRGPTLKEGKAFLADSNRRIDALVQIMKMGASL
jgi:hypothetical protein